MDGADYLALGAKGFLAVIVIPLAVACVILISPLIAIMWVLGWGISKNRALKDFIEDFD
ncbi:MAG TPA: hypothetical protein VNZ47_11910 [Candidatus Dormibacteraeota bacterium]|jgi:hypothetical protein|nr:hypothetical protein [Candidatus Dormibacteraeota bacterium]